MARALAAGASGYVVKGSPAEILRAVEAVLEGEVFVSDVAGGRGEDVERSGSS